MAKSSSKMNSELIKKLIVVHLVVALVAAFLAVPLRVSAAESLVVTDVSFTVGDNFATIIWHTSATATGRVDYGTSSGSYAFRVSTNQVKDEQAITLHGLASETTYYFKVTAVSSGSEATSFERSFKTNKSVDNISPTISNVAVAWVTGTTATIQWETNELASSEVEYGLTTAYGSNRSDGALVLVHDVTISGLQDSTTYQFLVKSRDKNNNVIRWQNLSFRTALSNKTDTDDLVIYDVEPTSSNNVNVTTNTAVITWRTNKLTSGKVRYGTSVNPGTVVVSNPPRDFFHSITLTGLQAGTTYYFDLESTDVFNRRVESKGYSFQTKSAGSTAPTDQDGEVLGASTDGLIVYLPFDEGKGSITYDQSFNNNNGQLDSNNPPSWTTGRFDNGLDFSHGGQNVQVNDNDQISLQEAVSIVAWVNIRNYGAYDKIATKENSYELLLGPSDGTLRMAIYADGAHDWQWLNTPGTPLSKNGWLLVTGTYDGDTMRLYVNTQEVAQDRRTMRIKDTNYPLYVGGNVVDNQEYFDGLIDEVAVFNYALSAEEIETIYNNGLGRYLKDVGISTRSDFTGGSTTVSNGANPRVLGVSNIDQTPTYACNSDLGYTKIKALYKTTDSPDVWAILETGQKHYITSPASFNAYQCDWSRIKTVSRSVLNSYANASLARTPTNATVYHLYQRADHKWLKINIPSPTVFISYTGNYWGNVARINQLDIDAYPNVKLIKTADSTNVYLIEGSSKRLVPNETIFKARQFEWFEVVVVNQLHLESYQTIALLE